MAPYQIQYFSFFFKRTMVVSGHIQPKHVNLHLKKCAQNRAERGIGNLY